MLQYAYVEMIYATQLGKTATYVYIYVDTDNQIRLICPIKKRRKFIDFDITVLLDTYRLTKNSSDQYEFDDSLKKLNINASYFL